MRTDKEIIIRLKSPTPKFWKKMRKIFLALGAIGVIIAQGGEYYHFVPNEIKWVFATAGLVGWFLSSMTTQVDPNKAIYKIPNLGNTNLDNLNPSEEILWKDEEDKMYLTYLENTNLSEEKKKEIKDIFDEYGFFPLSKQGILPESEYNGENL